MNTVIFTYNDAPQERITNANTLKNILGNTAHIYTGGTSTCNNWINVLETYNNDSLLFLEDDVQLCNDFTNKVDEYINLYPNFVLNFHFNNFNTETRLVSSYRYAWNQCVYFPKEVVNKLLRPSKEFIKHYSYFVNNNAYATQIRYALCKSGIKEFYAIEPKLVKSLNFVSTISNHTTTTRNFIDE